MARPGLSGHRKFRRLARALGSAITARGVLELLWDHCYEAGDDYVGTADDIEAIVDWAEAHGSLTRALVDAGAPDVGFIEAIDREPDSVPAAPDTTVAPMRYRVHDLWHHAPDYVRKRRERELQRIEKLDPAVRGEKRRGVGRAAPNGGHCPPSPDWQDGDGRTPSPSPSPSPSTQTSSGSCEPPSDSPPIALVFPVVGNGPKTWGLTESHVSDWAEAYPQLDILAECRKALAWVNANQRKTAAGMPKFLVNWLNRTVQRGGNSRPSARASSGQSRSGIRSVWSCPHVEHCAHRAMCEVKNEVGPEKYPVKQDVPA